MRAASLAEHLDRLLAGVEPASSKTRQQVPRRLRRGVGGIILLALLDEGFDRFGGKQLHRVTKAAEDTRPVMRGATGLHHHHTTLLLLKEGDQVAPAHLALELHLSRLVHAVDLED